MSYVRARGMVIAWRPLFAVLVVLPVTLLGCGGRNTSAGVESGPELRLGTGETFRFVDHFAGVNAPPELPRGTDGRVRVQLGAAREMALCAPAPYTFKQSFSLPSGARFRTAFGMSPGQREKMPSRIRFTVRMRRNGETRELLSEEVGRWGGGRGRTWMPVTIELPAGKVELELVTEAVGKGPKVSGEEGTACAVWVNPIVAAPAKGPPPDIILVLLDDLRADHLGCYGYPRKTSPFLDSLAERGVVFEDATAQATWTFASVRGMLTSAHRLATFAPDLRTPDMPGSGEAPRSEPLAMVTSLPGELRKAGYETMGCVGGGFLDPRFGCDTGFDWYWSPTTTPMLGDQLSAVKKRLERTKPHPFFLLLHTYEVHHYRDGWGHGLEQFDRGYTGELRDGGRLRQALEAGLGSLSEADLEHIIDLYDGEIWHSDRQLRAFFDWLFEQPWARDAIVVITADHGEAFGEHGLTWHGGPPYRELTHVPLILYRPAGGWQGRRIRQPVSLADLAPTLLDLAGASRPMEMVGRTLVPLAEGKAASGRPMLCGSETAVMVRDGPLWYMSWRGTRGEELYDVDRDPGQERNLAESDPTARAKMRRLLADLAMQASHGYRLAVVGPRDEPLAIQTTSTEGFSYFDVPTLRAGDRVEVEAAAGERKSQRKRKALYEGKVKVVLAAGDDPHVILFEPAARGATVRVEAATKTGSVKAERFHLGRKGSAPRGLPVVIGPGAEGSLVSERPPVRGDAEGWGIWLWRPSGAAREAQESGGGTLSENLEKQLRSLGYLK